MADDGLASEPVAVDLVDGQNAVDVAEGDGDGTVEFGHIAGAAWLLAAAGFDVGDAGALDDLVGAAAGWGGVVLVDVVVMFAFSGGLRRTLANDKIGAKKIKKA